MKEFTEEEVVELLHEAVTYSHCSPNRVKSPSSNNCAEFVNNFAKEKGLLKEEFEKGKWYRRGYDFIYYTCESMNYGIMGGQWRNDIYFSTAQEQLYIPATDKEVSEALIKGAKKYIGKTVKCLEDGIRYIVYELDYWCDRSNTLWCNSDSGINICLFQDGKWAEIVEEKEAPLEVIINGETYIKK